MHAGGGDPLIGFALSAPTDRRVFLAWDRPFLEQAVGWLGESFDLSGVLAVVPTAQAGRRLREALAARAAAAGRAVFPPAIVEPEGLLRLLGEGRSAPVPVASRLECLAAWAEVLVAMRLEEYRAVFPVDPPARNFAWAIRIGQQLMALQRELAEGGLTCAAVAQRAASEPDFPERWRWEQLARLEGALAARLARDGRVGPEQAALEIASDPALPGGIKRIVVLGTADPLPLALRALETVASRLPPEAVQVLVAAPESEAGAFDAWGRPRPDVWSGRPLEWADFSAQVSLRADPSAQAEAAASLAASYGSRRSALAVGCPDPEIIPPLARALSAAGIPSFDPRGRRRGQEGFHHLLSCLADLARDPSFEAVEAAGRCSEVLAYLGRRLGPRLFSAARWMAGLDSLRQRHLPADLESARSHAPELEERHSGLTAALAALDDLRNWARGKTFAEGASRVLKELFAGRRATPDAPDEAALAEAAEAWMDIVRDCQPLEERGDFRPEDWWDAALRLYGESWRAVDKPPGALELQGWMELLWEDAPHLVVAGLNDGVVPGAIVGDSFLPETLRERLGLKTNADRLARDAYLLQALAANRARRGRLDILVGKASGDGDPLRPSRLLLLCEPQALPARVRMLFRELPASNAPVRWRRAWRLKPPAARAGFAARLSVTALRDWLACPFRFYLRRGLAMEPIDPAKSEMDPMDFGTLCHAALQAMGEEEGLRDCTDARELEHFLLARLESRVRAAFGTELSLPLIIQVESARQRLRRLAKIQAQERSMGWRIEDVERKLTVDIAGITVVAKVDRIDRHQETGAVRVLDYKTSDTPASPAEAHLRNLRRDEAPPAFALWRDDAKTQVWKDLQLPLYRHALAATYPALGACGYINLPKAVSESAVRLWEPYPLELQTAAVACAEAVCRAIQSGEFWPPNPAIKPADDAFAPLFHQGAADSVAWSEAR